MKVFIPLFGLCIIIGAVLLYIHVGYRKHPSVQSSPSAAQTVPSGLRYLPLGDSYTIGQSVNTNDRWPNQLVAKFGTTPKPLQIIANPSVTGYTTNDLIQTELPLIAKLHPDIVSVLIGVNDYIQGVSAESFEKNLNFIVDNIQAQLANPANLFLVTIPDYSKTPTGAQFGDPTMATAHIAAFNTIIKRVAQTHNLTYADIFPVSQAVSSDQTLIADDGLHPSGKQYSAWTDIIYRAMQNSGIPKLPSPGSSSPLH